MSFVAYAIVNPEGLIYKGMTEDLDKRLCYHNAGLGHWTKLRGPWKLIYQAEFETKTEALKHERFLKSGKGRERLKILSVESGCSVVG